MSEAKSKDKVDDDYESDTDSDMTGISKRDSTFDPQWYSSGLSLLDLLVLIDSYIEYFQRSIKERKYDIQRKKSLLKEFAESRASQLDKRLEDLKKGAGYHLDHFNDQLDALNDRIIRDENLTTRQKISFFLGVNLIVITTVIFCLRPQYMPAFYTTVISIVIPLRIYTYRKKLYHYFLFDVCYYVNALSLIYLWILPNQADLFQACYGLTLGTLGTAIVTWRNSLVFHSLDKITSLAIHILPPLVFTALRHMDPSAPKRYPPVANEINPWRAMGISILFYLIWQFAYYKFVIVARRDKIKAGRVTSFTFLVNDKRRLIGKIASHVRPSWREALFILGQFIYTVLSLIIPYFVLYDSLFWSCVYLYFIFMASVWSGASFYVEKTFKPLREASEREQEKKLEDNFKSSMDNTPQKSPSNNDTPQRKDE